MEKENKQNVTQRTKELSKVLNKFNVNISFVYILYKQFTMIIQFHIFFQRN